jgi:hypothetical protein
MKRATEREATVCLKEAVPSARRQRSMGVHVLALAVHALLPIRQGQSQSVCVRESKCSPTRKAKAFLRSKSNAGILHLEEPNTFFLMQTNLFTAPHVHQLKTHIIRRKINY